MEGRGWTLVGGLTIVGTILSVMVSLQNISPRTRIDKFRPSNGSPSAPKGSTIRLDWKVEGWGAKTSLNKEAVGNEDYTDVAVNERQTYTLVSEGFWGRDSRQLTITAYSGDSRPGDNQEHDTTHSSGPSASLLPPNEIQPAAQSGGSAQTPRPQPPQSPQNANSLRGSSSSDVDLNARKASEHVSVAQGYLTVRSNVRGTSIAIGNLGTFPDEVTELPCFPGSYEVTASHPYLKTQVSSVIVTSGQHANLNIELSPDPSIVQRALSEAGRQADGTQPQRAVKMAKDVLAVEPQSLTARSVLALAYFNAHDMPDFYQSAEDALHHGAIVSVVLMHRDNSSPSPIHQVRVVIRQNSISFGHDLNNLKCDLPQGVVPLRSGDSAQIARDGTGQVFLSLKLHDSDRFNDIQLWQLGTQVERRPVNRGIFTTDENVAVSTAGAPQVLDTVAAVLRAAIAEGR